jgi:hypothetical protein
MFGFIVKKEYVLNKIKEYLNYQEEIDIDNIPEVFKETIEEHFSIECLNNKNIHLIIPELKNKLNEMNPESDIKNYINLVCLSSGELNIGYVMKEELHIKDSFTCSFDRSQYFVETEIQNLLYELKEFIGLQYIQSDTNHLEIKVFFDYEKLGSSFIQEFAYLNERISRHEEILKIIHENNSEIFNNVIQYF